MAITRYVIGLASILRRYTPLTLCTVTVTQLGIAGMMTAGGQTPGGAPSTVAPQDSGVLTGVVRAEDTSPLRFARVSIAGTSLKALTDSGGTFRLAGVPAGMQTIEVGLLGYSPFALPVEVLGGESMNVRVILSRNASVTLNPVEVHGDSALMSPLIKGFQARRARGGGTYFDRDEITAMQPRQVTDVLRRVSGLRIDGFGSGSVVQMSRNEAAMGNRLCPAVFFMNGSPFPLTEQGSINTFVAAEELVAVEVYNGASQIPPQFQSGMYNTRCGVVALWTRSGPEARPSRHGSTDAIKPQR